MAEPTRSQITDPPELLCFHDGACPLCSREVRMLQRLDRRGRIAWADIAEPGFTPPDGGPSLEELEGSLHVQLADGRYVDGMDSFRALYRAVGLGWLLAPTGWPGLRPLFDLAYRAFARVRPYLPGRPPEPECTDRCQPVRGARP